MKTFFKLLLFFAISNAAFGQKGDTILIDRTNVNPSLLKPGVHQYLVYFRMGKDSSRTMYQMWTREISFITYQGKKAINIRQVWEDNATVVHKVNSICSAADFSPLFHESWWKTRGSSEFDFITRKASVNGKPLTEADTARNLKSMYQAYQSALDQYVLNWHLDMEVFPILPYKKGVTFLINFYDPGFPKPSLQAYTVVGSDVITGYEQQPVECWLLSHDSKPGQELFWISKKTREVLKLEQSFNGRYRYKIKMGIVAP